MRCFAILLLATAVLAAPKKTEDKPKAQDKRSLGHSFGDAAIAYSGLGGYGGYGYGLGGYGLGGYGYGLTGYPSLGYSGYSGLGLGKLYGSGVTLGNSLTSAYSSGLEYGGAYNSLGSGGVIVGSGAPVFAHASGYGLGGVNVLPSAKAEHITGLTVHREVQVPVPVPHPVPVEVTKHVPVAQPVPVKVDRPYPVPVPQPVAVPVTRHVPVKVDRPYPVPVPHPVEVRVPQPVPVPVSQPVPVPVSVTRHVPYSVSSYNVVPSTYGVATTGIAASGLSSGLAHGITSGHEYVDLGSSHFAPTISGATLSSSALLEPAVIGSYHHPSAIISSGSYHQPGTIISSGSVSGINGLEHLGSYHHPGAIISSGLTPSLLSAHNVPLSTPLKKW